MAKGPPRLRPDDEMDAPMVLMGVCAWVKRDGRVRLELVGDHPHPMLVRCTEKAWLRGKRARLCNCPPCREAYDSTR